MSNWKKVRLGDVCKIKHGFAFKGEYFTDTPNNNILLTPGNFAIGGGYKCNKEKYYSGFIPTGYILNPGDIVVTMTDLSKAGDTLGYSVKIPQDRRIYLHNQRIGLVEFLTDSVLPNFIYWLMRSNNYQRFIVNSSTGSTVKHTSPTSIQSYEFLLPPLAEQERIGKILGALDDKIDCNNRINCNLEEQAAALFRRWFVDFEFPDSNGNPYRSSGGSFIDCPLGKIPTGWNIGKLEEYIEFDPREKIDKSSEYLFFDMKCLSNTDCAIKEGVYRMTTSASSFRNLDTLLAKITPCLENGKTGFVMNLKDNQIARGSTEFVVLRSKGKVSPFWIYLLARSSEFRDLAIQSMTGSSGRQRVQYSTIKNIEVATHTNAMNKFHRLIEPLFTQLNKKNKENRSLADLRDTLLPKLMNNEIKTEQTI